MTTLTKPHRAEAARAHRSGAPEAPPVGQPSAQAPESDAGLVRAARTGLGLTRAEFSRLTGFSERAIARWEAGERLSAPSRLRMLEVWRLRQELTELMDPEAAHRWLLTPNPAYNGLKPLEVVERGQIHHVWRTIFQLQEGGLS